MSPKRQPTEKPENISGGSPSLSTNSDYYLRGGDLYFLLHHTLYRVHSYFFIRESAFWKKELVGPTDSGDGPLLKGDSSTNAIILDEDPKNFDCLLWVFYNRNFGDFSKAGVQEWIAIIRYATRWDFPDIKEVAIRYLETHEMEPIARIKLYQENCLPDKYLFPLYVSLAEREELLGLEESRALGIETLVLIQQARERLRAPPRMGNHLLSPIRTDLKPTDVIDIVSATFNISFTEVDPNPGSGGGSGSGSTGGQVNGGSSSGRSTAARGGGGGGGGGGGRGRGGK